MTNLFLFDVDGTLAESTQKIPKSLIKILKKISEKHVVCVVSGGTYKNLIEQIGKRNEKIFKYIFAENGSVVYQNGEALSIKNIKDEFTEYQIQDIVNTILEYIVKLKIPYKRGKFIDFRTAMLYISPTGSNVSYDERQIFAQYDEEHDIRKKMIEHLKTSLCTKYDLDIKLGGQIGIGLHPRGWDKSLALEHLNLSEYLNTYFFGDKCGKDGNDYVLFSQKNICGFEVTGPDHTLHILKTFL